MKTNITKTGRVWEWEIVENGEHLRGGHTKTKGDAENDSRIVMDWLLAERAREAGRIAKGDLIKIKPEWMDEGDDQFNFFAVETQLEGMDSVRVRAIHKESGEPGIGVQSIHVDHIESHRRIFPKTHVLHHIFEDGGITLVLDDGRRMHETTPSAMTGGEHLSAWMSRLP